MRRLVLAMMLIAVAPSQAQPPQDASAPAAPATPAGSLSPAPAQAPLLAPALAPASVLVPVQTPAATTGVAAMDVEDLRMFVEVMDQIRASYVEPVPDHTLWVDAVRGMLESLDPHSEYLDRKDYRTLREDTSGAFDGVGLELNMDNDQLKVVAPIDGSPAQKAGIRAGDVIIKLNGQLVHGQSMQALIAQMNGAPGSRIVITIQRGDGPLQDIAMQRAHIAVSAVQGSWIVPGEALLRISMFTEKTGQDLEAETRKLRATGTIRGVVLDLRNNPGGVLNGAVEVADDFLDQGVIVSTHGRIKDADQRFVATPGQLFSGVPVVVLINGGTASAAEIVAGALQDQHRALLLGTTSFGKGSVQSVLPLRGERGIKLTTARYYTPSGRSIQAHGIVPDLIVRQADVKINDDSDQFYHEADLAGHLGNQQKASSADAPSEGDRLLAHDFQLYQALSILRAQDLMHPAASSDPGH